MKDSESQQDFSDYSKEQYTCQTCGEKYEHPLLAEILSGPSPEEYYACSRCLSKVPEPEKESVAVDVEPEPVPEEPEEPKIEEEPREVLHIPPTGKIEVEIQASCQHELGYLKKRDRSSPLPDECLICSKMIDCM